MKAKAQIVENKVTCRTCDGVGGVMAFPPLHGNGPMLRKCPDCGGAGFVRYEPDTLGYQRALLRKKCPECLGSGQVVVEGCTCNEDSGGQVPDCEVTCPECKGVGTIMSDPPEWSGMLLLQRYCPECHGTGREQ